MEHYQCYKVWEPETGGIRHLDIVEVFPQQIPFPNISTADYLRQAATDIIAILQNKSSNLSSLTYEDTTSNVYVEISTIL